MPGDVAREVAREEQHDAPVLLRVAEATERDPYFTRIMINSATARKKGLSDGARVCVESPHGRIEGTLKFTETIHPEVLGTIGCWGHRTEASVARGRGPGNFNSLLGSGLQYMGPSTLQAECAARAKIYPAGMAPGGAQTSR